MLIGRQVTYFLLEQMLKSYLPLFCKKKLRTFLIIFKNIYSNSDTVVKCKGISPKGNIISNKNLYETYSLKGANSSEISKGNFLSYVKRCKRVFGANEKVVKVLNTHYGKIKKRLKKIK